MPLHVWLQTSYFKVDYLLILKYSVHDDGEGMDSNLYLNRRIAIGSSPISFHLVLRDCAMGSKNIDQTVANKLNVHFTITCLGVHPTRRPQTTCSP